MKDGRSIGDFKVADLTQPDLIRLISGSEIGRFKRTARTVDREVALTIQGLNRPGAYHDLGLTVRKGEIIGLTGLEGCGKDALARGLFGLEPMGAGNVLLEGKPYRAHDPRTALNHGVAYLPRDRHGLGIVGLRSIRENITLPIISRLAGRLGFIATTKEAELVAQLIRKLNVKATSMNQAVQFQRRQSAKGRFCEGASVNPQVLLLDEPTQGVDVQAKIEILRIVDQLAQEGGGHYIL
jgi:ABC-type sugar transport system ATPase subunit